MDRAVGKESRLQGHLSRLEEIPGRRGGLVPRRRERVGQLHLRGRGAGAGQAIDVIQFQRAVLDDRTYRRRGWRRFTAKESGRAFPCKEDARHLHGKGNFVADMAMPGCARWHSCAVRWRMRALPMYRVPESVRDKVVLRSMMGDARDIAADSTLPTYQPSVQPPLASGKVRFVGEPVAMTFAPTRAEAEDHAELVEVDYDDLPVYADVASAQQATSDLVHEHWRDNVFVTLNADRDFDEHAARAEVVVKRKIDLARQCMVPHGRQGGAGLLGPPGRPAGGDQRHASAAHDTQRAGPVPGPRTGPVRVVSPDVGGAFGYKCVLQQEGLCVAWLAKTYKRPFRFIEDRREHLTAGANSREHHYEMTAYADKRGKAAGAGRPDHDRRRRLFGVALHHRARAWPGGRQPARALWLSRLPLRDALRGHQQARLRAISRRGAYRRASPSS